MIVHRHLPSRCQELIRLGLLRDKVKGRAGKPRGGFSAHHFDGFESAWIHILGTTSEGAYGDRLGIEIDWDINLYGDQGWDLTLPDGRTAQVKSRERYYPDAYLLFNGTDDFLADVALLACPLSGVCEWGLMGWITKAEFLRQHWLHDFNYGPRAVVTAQELHSLDELL